MCRAWGLITNTNKDILWGRQHSVSMCTCWPNPLCWGKFRGLCEVSTWLEFEWNCHMFTCCLWLSSWAVTGQVPQMEMVWPWNAQYLYWPFQTKVAASFLTRSSGCKPSSNICLKYFLKVAFFSPWKLRKVWNEQCLGEKRQHCVGCIFSTRFCLCHQLTFPPPSSLQLPLTLYWVKIHPISHTDWAPDDFSISQC